MIWKAKDVLNAVLNAPGVSKAEILNDSEDRTTQSIHIQVAGTTENLWVRGFTTGEKLRAPDNTEVEMVELTTGYSDGDMPNDPALILAYAQVKVALSNIGYPTVQSMEPYF